MIIFPFRLIEDNRFEVDIIFVQDGGGKTFSNREAGMASEKR